VYDLRTNQHFTLKANSLKRSDRNESVSLYHAENRHDREPTWSEANPLGRWLPIPTRRSSSATR
jgi:type I restriction enzyme M protein